MKTAMDGEKTIRESSGRILDVLVKRKFKVLVCDDSDDEHFFTKRALSRSVSLRQIGAVRNGHELRDYLSGFGKFEDRDLFPFPDLILLDIDMPVWDGLQTLEWLQANPSLNLQVVVLSDTSDPAKIARALELGANYFQSKTSDPAVMTEFLYRLELLMALLENRYHLAVQSNKFMLTNTIQVVDGRAPPWAASITAAASTGRNFILVLENEAGLERLWAALGTTNVVPDRLHRWGVLGMAEALSQQDYSLLLTLYKDHPVYLVEQLTLNRNVPPKTKPIMLYCELRGIISGHDTVEEAGLSLLKYLERFSCARLLPLAGIYEFRDEQWQRVRKLSSDKSAVEA